MADNPNLPISFYDEHAETYAVRPRETPADRLEAFAELLPAGGKLLELGCGAGADSAWLIERGFDVVPTDGSAAMAREAEARLCRPVRILRFSDLDEATKYDGVWANACLLHVPRAQLSDVLVRIHHSLLENGVFYASFKTGAEEGLDRYGRYYNRPSREWLRELYGLAGFAIFRVEIAHRTGYDGEPTDWIHVWARA